jgi:hypothetical protein
MDLPFGISLRSTAAAAVSPTPRSVVWNETFDMALLVAPVSLGLLAAAFVSARPQLYAAVVLADLWFLGYHHVVSTYTRLGFSPRNLRLNRFLAVDLLIAVVLATTALAFTAGAWVVATAFLYLQWFHYMRQGYGISRMYFRATNEGKVADARDLIADLVVYVVPICAIVHRSVSIGDVFLGMPVKAIVPSSFIVTMVTAAALIMVAVWGARAAHRFSVGTADLRYEGLIFSHIVIFTVAYIWIDDANVGWLAINVWHNLQYVLVVWMVNVKRYAGRIDASEPLLSRISQPGRAVMYFGCCLGITTIIYAGLNQFTALVLGGGLTATLGVYMGINFHHYVVDALIWKRPGAGRVGAAHGAASQRGDQAAAVAS